jgi:hypothetical protein
MRSTMLLILMCVLVTCQPGLAASVSSIKIMTLTPSPAANLPDLVTVYVNIHQSGLACTSQTSVYIENTGTADAGPFAIKMNNNQQEVMAGLPAGQAVTVYFADGPGDATAIADPDNRITESDETNNTRYNSVPFTSMAPNIPCTPLSGQLALSVTSTPKPAFSPINLALPDLALQRVQIGNDPRLSACYDQSLPLGLILSISNYGRVDAGQFDVRVGNDSQTVPGLAANQVITLWFSGTVNYSIQIDQAGTVKERNEYNTVWEMPWYPTGRTDTCSPDATP